MKDIFSRKGWIILVGAAFTAGVFFAWAQLVAMYPGYEAFVAMGAVCVFIYIQIWAHVEYNQSEKQ